jgi:hypothetical protein
MKKMYGARLGHYSLLGPERGEGKEIGGPKRESANDVHYASAVSQWNGDTLPHVKTNDTDGAH